MKINKSILKLLLFCSLLFLSVWGLKKWYLSEKSELESRTFQMLALQTQIQGTMRKKEKDYEKLQGQLDKVVRDSMRGNKAVIVVSKPHKSVRTI